MVSKNLCNVKQKITFISIDDEKEDLKNDDTNIVPTGKVSERTNAFESKPEPTGELKTSPGPVLKRSESNLTADMQKKYQVSFIIH